MKTSRRAGRDRGAAAGRVFVPALLSVGIVGGLVLFQVTGLFQQIGRPATGLVIAGDLLVLGLIWYRALR
jgi:hypothetical protein